MSENERTQPGRFMEHRVKGNTLHLLISSLVINLLGLAMPLMLLQAYDRILPNHGIGTLGLLVAGVACAVILEVILRLARASLTGWAGAVFEHKMSCDAMAHLLNSEVIPFERQGSGSYIQKMAAIAKLRSFYSGQALMTLVDLPFVLTFLALIAYIGGALFFVPLALFIFFCLTSWLLGLRLKREVREQDHKDKIRYNFLIETLTGIHSIKSQGLEKFFMRRNDRLQEAMSSAHYRVALSGSLASSSGMLIGQIMSFAVVSFGALKVIDGDMGTGGLAACLLLSGRIIQPVQRALGLWTRFQSFFIDRQELQEIFSLPVARKGGLEKLGRTQGMIRCRKLGFSYNVDGPGLFKDLSLLVSPGQSISLVGAQTTGKTTFLLLLAGLLSPSEGEIEIDGVQPAKVDPVELARHIGFLPEKATIFSGTILDNLTFFGTIAKEDALLAAGHLGITDAIALLPKGFQTVLADGVTDPIPPGLKQRIAIARALATRPKIILFDNADRGLDRDGYNLVFKTLGRLKGRATMIFVSDDRNILRLADKEYHIVDGRLQENAPLDSKTFTILPFRELRA